MTDQKYDASEEFNGSWDDVPSEYVPPAEGVYRAKITEAKRSSSKSEGKPMAVLTVKLTYNIGADEDADGESRYNNVMITQSGKSAFRLKQLVEAADIQFPKSPKPDDVDDFCSELLGKEVCVRIRHKRKEGKDAVFLEVSRFLTEEQAIEAAQSEEAA